MEKKRPLRQILPRMKVLLAYCESFRDGGRTEPVDGEYSKEGKKENLQDGIIKRICLNIKQDHTIKASTNSLSRVVIKGLQKLS